jgi:hypothetical protein
LARKHAQRDPFEFFVISCDGLECPENPPRLQQADKGYILEFRRFVEVDLCRMRKLYATEISH